MWGGKGLEGGPLGPQSGRIVSGSTPTFGRPPDYYRSLVDGDDRGIVWKVSGPPDGTGWVISVVNSPGCPVDFCLGRMVRTGESRGLCGGPSDPGVVGLSTGPLCTCVRFPDCCPDLLVVGRWFVRETSGPVEGRSKY